jgi:hypothetical protein
LIVRETNAARLNEIANHPAVRALAGTEHAPRYDLTPVLAIPGNVYLEGESGGCLFTKIFPGLYEAHLQLLPSVPARSRQELLAACLEHVLLRHDANEVFTRIPALDLSLRAAKAAGMRQESKTRRHSDGTPVYGLAIRLQDWVAKTSHMAHRGRWLCDRFSQEAARLGFDLPAAEDSDISMHYLGAMTEMAFGGQHVKAVNLWNRHVALTGLRWGEKPPHVSLASVAPLIIRFPVGLVRFGSDDIDVLLDC